MGLVALALEVRRRHPHAAHLQVAGRLPVVLDPGPLVLHDVSGVVGTVTALLAFDGGAGRLLEAIVLWEEHAGRSDRAHLRHAPRVDHARSVYLLPFFDHRRRTRRSADGDLANG